MGLLAMWPELHDALDQLTWDNTEGSYESMAGNIAADPDLRVVVDR